MDSYFAMQAWCIGMIHDNKNAIDINISNNKIHYSLGICLSFSLLLLPMHQYLVEWMRVQGLMTFIKHLNKLCSQATGAF